MNELYVSAILKFDNVQEELLVKLDGTYKESFLYIGKLLEDSTISSLSEDTNVVLKYSINDREYYILGKIEDIIEQEQFDKEMEETIKLNNALTDISNNFNSKEEYIMLKKYVLNNKIDNIKDLERQAIIITGKNLKYEPEEIDYENFHYDFSDEELEVIKKLDIPYTIEEIERWDPNNENNYEMICKVYDTIYDAIVNSKNRNETRILNRIMDEIFPKVDKKDVKEIHIFNLDRMDMNIIFLDEAGVYEIVSRKAKLYFKDGRTKIGYVGSDFKVNDDDCICIFESYDNERGFGDYNYYLLDDLYKVEVIENSIPRYKEKIDFEFNLPEIKW